MLSSLFTVLVTASLETVSVMSTAAQAQAIAGPDATMASAMAMRVATVCTAEELFTAALVGDWAVAQQPAVAGTVTPPLRLMSTAKDVQLRQLLPKVADAKIARLLADPALILYTDDEMPKAYQFWDNQHAGVHSASYNISANGSERYGNGNREFPWSGPAGTHRTDNVRTFRFLWLPRDEQGRQQPVVWYRQQLEGDSSQGYAWVFPVGTVVGEVLTLRAPAGGDYTFEMRVRVRQYGGWDVDVFRPFPRSSDLMARVRELRPAWQTDPALVKLDEHLANKSNVKAFRLADYHPGGNTFDQTMGVDPLPPIDEKLVAELLGTTTFHSAEGAIWRTAANGTAASAPTTTARFHIVPAKYDAGFIEVDSNSCVRCHDTVNKPVARFDRGRDWYGHIRGSDGIFSFHPFAPSSISGNGYPRTVSMRREFEAAGLLERFSARKHRHARYQILTARGN